jgi:2-succinyl-5-enolpyruvyl-6-hydroxy-3-cyclohexene-1-carboxylate synthase
LREFFEARHQFDASHFAKMFDLDYELVDDFQKLSQISSFFLKTDIKPYILELKTEPTENYSVYHSYFKNLENE